MKHSDMQLHLALQGLADALASVTNHLAQVLDGPIMRGCGVSFPNGTDNVPTIKQARAALKNAEPFLKKETT